VRQLPEAKQPGIPLGLFGVRIATGIALAGPLEGEYSALRVGSPPESTWQMTIPASGIA